METIPKYFETISFENFLEVELWNFVMTELCHIDSTLFNIEKTELQVLIHIDKNKIKKKDNNKNIYIYKK